MQRRTRRGGRAPPVPGHGAVLFPDQVGRAPSVRRHGGVEVRRVQSAGAGRAARLCRPAKLVADTKTKMEGLKPDEVNALEGRDVAFQFGETKIPFTAETFVLSF